MTTPTGDSKPASVSGFSRLHHFHGGLVLEAHSGMSTTQPVAAAGIPDELVIPLQQADVLQVREPAGERVVRDAKDVAEALVALDTGDRLSQDQDRPAVAQEGGGMTDRAVAVGVGDVHVRSDRV